MDMKCDLFNTRLGVKTKAVPIDTGLTVRGARYYRSSGNIRDTHLLLAD